MIFAKDDHGWFPCFPTKWWALRVAIFGVGWAPHQAVLNGHQLWSGSSWWSVCHWNQPLSKRCAGTFDIRDRGIFVVVLLIDFRTELGWARFCGACAPRSLFTEMPRKVQNQIEVRKVCADLRGIETWKIENVMKRGVIFQSYVFCASLARRSRLTHHSLQFGFEKS